MISYGAVTGGVVIIDIWLVPEEGERRTGELPAAILELGETGGLITATRPIRYDVRVEVRAGELIVRGALETAVEFACVRCAEHFDLRVADGGFQHYQRIENKFTSVDLTPEMRETILLAFPTHPVCAPECRGLCARCGTNLNRGVCRCVTAPADGLWHVLEGLSLHKGGSDGGSKKKKVKK